MHNPIITCIVLALFTTVSSAAEKETVTVAMSLTPLSAPFIIADDKGFFSKEGIDVSIKEFRGGYRAIKAMFDGHADIATSSEAVVMFNSLKRNDFGIFATFVTSDNDVKIMACDKSGINSVTDLAGKRVGTVVGASSHFFLSYTLLMNGVAEQSVKIIPLHPEDTPRKCLHDDIDAVVIWEPYPYLMKKEPGSSVHEVPHHRDYIETFNAVVKHSYAEQNKATLKAVVRALIRTTDYMKKHPNESQLIVSRRLDKDLKMLKKNWGDYNFTVGLHQWLLGSIETEARWAIKNKFSDSGTIPNYLDYMITEPLKHTNPGLMTIIE